MTMLTAVELQARGAAAHHRNREARDAVVNAARLRFGLPADMKTADVLRHVAAELVGQAARAA